MRKDSFVIRRKGGARAMSARTTGPEIRADFIVQPGRMPVNPRTTSLKEWLDKHAAGRDQS
jgi:hypothetical protein